MSQNNPYRAFKIIKCIAKDCRRKPVWKFFMDRLGKRHCSTLRIDRVIDQPYHTHSVGKLGTHLLVGPNSKPDTSDVAFSFGITYILGNTTYSRKRQTEAIERRLKVLIAPKYDNYRKAITRIAQTHFTPRLCSDVVVHCLLPLLV